MNYVFVRRGTTVWLVQAANAEHLREICSVLGWEFDEIVDANEVAKNLYRVWHIGNLIDEIGDGR